MKKNFFYFFFTKGVEKWKEMCYNRDIKEREDLMKMLALQITFCVIGVVGSIFFTVAIVDVVRDMFF